MATNAVITAAQLRAILDYNPDTGLFVWLVDMSDRVHAGDLAGKRSKCGWYPRIRINGRLYLAHRLAWLWMTGEWPSAEIDHIDCDRGNNGWANLRAATHSQNNANKAPRKNNSGFKGVWLHRSSGLWHARIKVDTKEISLGYFRAREVAHEAYVHAANKYFGEFARTS